MELLYFESSAGDSRFPVKSLVHIFGLIPLNDSELRAGANVNSVKFHETALHHAARVNMVEMIELLLEFGASVYASDNLGRKPIDYTTPASPAYTCLSFYESKVLHSVRVTAG